jgi:hypothetical protein
MSDPNHASASPPREVSPLKAAVRQARIDAAEQTGVVIDLHDAELARLEILNEALDPVFADIPPDIELFDRGLTRGREPRLWIDMIAHVEMGRDKRIYRFMQDTRFGRRIAAESTAVEPIVRAVTNYVARRMVERERALAGDTIATYGETRAFATMRRKRRWKGTGLFVLGVLAGAVALLGLAWVLGPHY